jgi:hypothetical protein
LKIIERITNLFRRQPPTADEVAARAEAETERGESERQHDQLLGDGERARRW